MPSLGHRQKTCRRGHRFTKANTYVIPSNGSRVCRKCNTQRGTAWKRRNKDYVNARERKRYAANQTRELARQRAYRAKNRSRVNGWARDWRASNRDRHNARRRKLYAAHPETHRARSRDFYQRHPEYNLAWRARHRKRIYALLGKRKCVECGSSNRLQFHHRDPRTKLFTIGEYGNLFRPLAELKREAKKCVVLCRSCHMNQHRRAA